MADFLSLLLGIPALIKDFNGGTTAPYRSQQEDLAAQQAQYAQAAANPSSPLYQQTYGRYQNQNKGNLAQVIAEAQGQNRLNSRMGRTPLFSQDRGGEQLFRAMMQQYQGMGAQSDQQTQAALTNAGRLNNAGQAAYGAITPSTASANSAQLSGYKQIYNMFNPQASAQPTPQTTPQNYSSTNLSLMPQPPNRNSSLFSGLF